MTREPGYFNACSPADAHFFVPSDEILFFFIGAWSRSRFDDTTVLYGNLCVTGVVIGARDRPAVSVKRMSAPKRKCELFS